MSSPYRHGVTFPVAGAGSSYPSSASGYSPVSAAAPQVPIQPGSTTYTTTTLSDGSVQYNEFKAEARSYQTPQGLVHGIQWVPVNVSYEIPPNARLAGPEFHASFSRSNDKEAQRTLKEWQRDQEKRAKREEKESAKRMKEWEKERREREKAEEKELRRAQELDFQRSGRSRKLSDVGYGANYPTYSAPVPAGYTRTRSRSRARRDSAGQDELTRAMAEVAFEKAESEAMWGREKERRNSNAGRPRRVSVNERSRKVSTGEYERTRKTSGTPYPVSGYPTASGYPASTYSSYGAPPSPGRTVSQRMSPYTSGGGLPSAAGPSARRSYSDRASPYMGGGGLPPAEGTGPVYPPGHIYAGRPIPGMQGNNLGNATSTYRAPSPGLRRASSPAFLRGSSPRRGSLQLESPAGFTRQPSMAVPYTYFDPVLVLSDLNGLYQQLPTMPPVLVPHDVWLEDWVRCIEDIARAWVGKMPDRNMSTKKPHNVVAQLIDIWNASFFSLRGVELVLFRGRQRRSGPLAGRYDSRLGGEDFSDDESDTISSVSSDSDVENMFYGGTQSRYGVGGNSWLTDSREARRVRKAAKKLLEKQSRKRHEREKERGSGFSLYLTCANDGQPSRVPYAAATSAYLG